MVENAKKNVVVLLSTDVKIVTLTLLQTQMFITWKNLPQTLASKRQKFYQLFGVNVQPKIRFKILNFIPVS